MRQEITDMRLEMVFDDVLDAAARSLAKGEKAGMLHTAGASSDSQTLTFLRDRLLNTGSTAVEVGGGLVSGERVCGMLEAEGWQA
ncbi:hypothetical protein GUITHDRAFT_155810 [Guillardia theta CCMP2712]|uniref:Uncharacterized protein n=1 Tax=Guillardia theta (strain CCMP2712) TaxID=905079 RepID=L1ID55_GUITC|nr:hypothetical protein GUITHDRAFT_155810 [Guillardia theta CCMP2712]EKX34186.1 hypothetical protein GUITHDRAFT_155810 [Guillardia theta CCMP2712]|eukprot:XP_005821166.1 hypothetical protein GUITHDRAFT_155810 [Guillardia theta CCMP2712]